MTSSLVGSEMCIRDRGISERPVELLARRCSEGQGCRYGIQQRHAICLLYTSDAADELDGVDL
eukprot:6546764-Prorocentrum_lima.AAC.1